MLPEASSVRAGGAKTLCCCRNVVILGRISLSICGPLRSGSAGSSSSSIILHFQFVHQMLRHCDCAGSNGNFFGRIHVQFLARIDLGCQWFRTNQNIAVAQQLRCTAIGKCGELVHIWWVKIESRIPVPHANLRSSEKGNPLLLAATGRITAQQSQKPGK